MSNGCHHSSGCGSPLASPHLSHDHHLTSGSMPTLVLLFLGALSLVTEDHFAPYLAGCQSLGTHPERSSPHRRHPKTNVSWCIDVPTSLPSSRKDPAASIHAGSGQPPVTCSVITHSSSCFDNAVLSTVFPSSSHPHTPAGISFNSQIS